MQGRILPEGWTVSSIGDLSQYIQRGKSPKYAQFSGLPVVNQRCIRWYGIQNQHLKYVHEDQISAWGDDRYIHKGDILWNSTGTGTIGRACLVREEHLDPPKVVDSHVTIVRPLKHIIEPEYLFAWIRSPEVQQKIEDLATGTTNQIELSRASISSTLIPVAPLNEQRRIAAKLSTTLDAVEACGQRLDGVVAILKRFRQAVLAAATTGELTRDWRNKNPDSIDASGLARYLKINHQNAGGHRAGNAAPPTEGVHDLREQEFPHEWQLVCLRDIVKPERPITYGILKPGPELNHGIPYVRVADYPGNRLSLDGIRKTSPEIDELYKRSRLEQGDLLLSIRGTVGRLISIPAELIGANITQDSARLSIQELVDSFYVKTALQSEILQSRMRRAIKGVAVRGINIGDVRALQIPLPSIEEQEEISRRVKELLCLAEQLEAKLSAARKAADQITPALLTKAFQGELVLQDPNDQPVTELMAKLKAQQSNAAAASPPKRSKTHRKLPSMTNSDKDAIRAAILSLKSDHFSFDELRAQVGGDYESLKTALFELLEDTSPVVRQVFDDHVKAIVLERVKE